MTGVDHRTSAADVFAANGSSRGGGDKEEQFYNEEKFHFCLSFFEKYELRVNEYG